MVDRLVLPDAATNAEERAQFTTRLTDSTETALKLGDGFMIAMVQVDDGQQSADAGKNGEGRVPSTVRRSFRDILFSEKKVDPATGISYPDLEPKLFSFNAPQGACPECQGLGSKREIDAARVVPNTD